MQSCAVAFDGRDTSRRALELAMQFASVVEGTIHLIYATDDREAGLKVVGVAEATLSMQRVAFVTHVEPGKPGEVVARDQADPLRRAVRGRAHERSEEHTSELQS